MRAEDHARLFESLLLTMKAPVGPAPSMTAKGCTGGGRASGRSSALLPLSSLGSCVPCTALTACSRLVLFTISISDRLGFRDL